MHGWLKLAFLFTVAASGCKNISAGKAAPGAIGAACAVLADCAKVQKPVCLKMPQGYCSETCEGGAFDCDSESLCDALGDQAYYCLDGCLTENGNEDCRDEYRCSPRPDVSNLGGDVGVCLPRCKTDADCETGRRCDVESGDCVERGERKTGEPCGQNDACNGGLCLKADAFRGGYCSARCGNQFAECEPGSHCLDLEGSAVCLATCSADADCRAPERYRCRRIGTRQDADGNDVPLKVCAPMCQSNAECADGSHCDAASGECVTGIAVPNPLGAFCSRDADCASGACITDPRWPNGYCTAGCGGACGEGVCRPTALGDQCLAACAGDLDCRVGYTCLDGGCAGRCRVEADCAAGLRCNVSTGRCVEPGGGNSQVQVVEIAANVPVRSELSRELSLEAPAGVQSLAILAEGAGNDLMIIGEMRDPNGRVIYDFQDPFGSEARFFPSEDVITQFLPSSPRSAPIPGTYRFRLIKDGGQASVGVRAVIKTADGDPQEASLDVNFFFADVTGIDAASAPNDGKFQEAVSELRRIYAARGITVDTVAYCDLQSADAARFAVVDSIDGPGAELGQMFKQSGRAGDLGCNPERAINFFLVQEIVGGRAGYIILGIAGGIPGPPAVNATSHSGVAVTMINYRRNSTQLAQTMAHEGGHFLGLFHTTEAEGTAFDPLSDTPECPTRFDDDGDGVVAYDECGRGRGSENLMFWAAGGGAEQVSGDQAFVLIRNPALR